MGWSPDVVMTIAELSKYLKAFRSTLYTYSVSQEGRLPTLEGWTMLYGYGAAADQSVRNDANKTFRNNSEREGA
ncbi:hypothetical protein [Fontivita pretiosa]|uniref:hypothetical protein n=1 Tax=Fontivita pretiosa TaxID=2989684 RepID=UPI003D17778B